MFATRGLAPRKPGATMHSLAVIPTKVESTEPVYSDTGAAVRATRACRAFI